MFRAPRKSQRKLKICALGEEAVGKTSLIRRYVADKFEGAYTRTIGVGLDTLCLTAGDKVFFDRFVGRGTC